MSMVGGIAEEEGASVPFTGDSLTTSDELFLLCFGFWSFSLELSSLFFPLPSQLHPKSIRERWAVEDRDPAYHLSLIIVDDDENWGNKHSSLLFLAFRKPSFVSLSDFFFFLLYSHYKRLFLRTINLLNLEVASHLSHLLTWSFSSNLIKFYYSSLINWAGVWVWSSFIVASSHLA